MILPIQLFKTNPNAMAPTYATERSACFDIYACLNNGGTTAFECGEVTAFNANNFKDKLLVKFYGDKYFVYIPPQYRVLIPTGLIFGIPPQHSLRLHIRSGIALKDGIILANSEAIIDNDYPNETFVMLMNTSDVEYRIYHGDRIAQGELVKDERWEFQVVDFNPVIKSDRVDGLGHTGK